MFVGGGWKVCPWCAHARRAGTDLFGPPASRPVQPANWRPDAQAPGPWRIPARQPGSAPTPQQAPGRNRAIWGTVALLVLCLGGLLWGNWQTICIRWNLRQLKHPDESVRFEAAEALAKIGADAVPALVRAVTDRGYLWCATEQRRHWARSGQQRSERSLPSSLP